ncbi:type II toxin-antitoxin system Phd/YefM family antitoxin [Lagierella massiliensis]|uniref:type II toxin-antitoxin system Phd/YefM family antitoxin n=1 Tax=Lagierella massiliensis TaxID=1689303 RepID=UPI0006D80CEF|nr:type II toxin-antitoxin system Phd/YefM family antitoxin [Lagierella massiliensis]
MSYINITNFRKNAFEYINSAVEFGDVINISTKNGNAVVLSEQDYRDMLESIFFAQNSTMADILIEGKNTPLEECEEFEW